MDEKFIYIPNEDTQNYPFSKLQLVVETFEPSIKIQKKSPELLSQRIRIRYYVTLAIRRMSHPSL